MASDVEDANSRMIFGSDVSSVSSHSDLDEMNVDADAVLHDVIVDSGFEVPSYADTVRGNVQVDDVLPTMERELSDFEKEHFHACNVTPDRPCTAFFKSESFIASKDFFDRLEREGFPATSVRCFQRCPNGNNLVTFCNSQTRDRFLQNSSLIPRRFHERPRSRDDNLTHVVIYDAPHELPDSAIEVRLAPYCSVRSSRRGKFRDQPHCFNGLRHLNVELDHSIPSFLRFGKFQVRVWHEGQTKTCRRCNREGHIAKDCNNTLCFNCDELNHTAKECPHQMKCCICKGVDHLAAGCFHSWYRRAAAVRAAVHVVDHESQNSATDTAAAEDDTTAGDVTTDAATAVNAAASAEHPPLIQVLESGDAPSDELSGDQQASEPSGTLELFVSPMSDSTTDSQVPLADRPPPDSIPASCSDSVLAAVGEAAEVSFSQDVPSISESAPPTAALPKPARVPVSDFQRARLRQKSVTRRSPAPIATAMSPPLRRATKPTLITSNRAAGNDPGSKCLSE